MCVITYDFSLIIVTGNGNWGQWQATPCTKTCGSGQQTKYRQCNDPPPSNGGLQCAGVDGIRAVFERICATCNTQACPSKYQSSFHTLYERFNNKYSS